MKLLSLLSLSIIAVTTHAEPLTQDMQNACNAETYRAAIVLPNQKQNEQARSTAFEMATRQALQFAYLKSGSSDTARAQVQRILEENHCDASAVGAVDFEKWHGGGKETLGFDISWQATLQNIYSNTSSKSSVPFEYASLIEAQGKGLSLPPADQVMTDQKWNTLGYSSACASTMRRVEAVCSGKISAKTLFDELIKVVDPKLTENVVLEYWRKGTLMLPKILSGTIPGGTIIYKGLSMDAIRRDRETNKNLRETNAALRADNDVQQGIINHLEKGESNSDHYSDITGDVVTKEEIAADANAKKEANDSAIAANNKKIEENIEHIKMFDPQAKDDLTSDGQGTKDPDDEELAIERAFEQFIYDNWKVFQNQTANRYPGL